MLQNHEILHSFCPQAEWLARALCAAGFPAAYVAGGVAQEERMGAMDALRGFKLRVSDFDTGLILSGSGSMTDMLRAPKQEPPPILLAHGACPKFLAQPPPSPHNLQVAVSTDVLARGVDLERVNLVVNLDLPVGP